MTTDRRDWPSDAALLRTAPRAVRLIAGSLFALLVVFLAVWGADATVLAENPKPDFEYFYQAGRWLVERGVYDPGFDVMPGGWLQERGTIEWYLPAVARLMTLVAWMPYQAAGGVWLAINLVAFVTIVRLIGQYLMGVPKTEWRVATIAPLLLLLPAWYWEFSLNQIDTLTLLLIVASYVHWQQGKSLPAGVWLGFATVLKLAPGLLIVWFALKRQWRVVGYAVLTGALLGPVADLSMMLAGRAYAEQRLTPTAIGETVEAYAAWAERAVVRGSHRGLILEQREMDWRNQGTGAVLSRWLHQTSYSLKWDNDPRLISRAAPQYINVADWPRERVVMVQVGVSVVLLAGLLWLWRKPASASAGWQLRIEFALAVLALLWFMPVMRWYHIVMAFPAVAMLGAALHYQRFRGWWSGLAVACVLSLPLSAVIMGQSVLAAAAGGGLMATLLLGLPLVLMIMRLQRDPHALKPDPTVERRVVE
jgi:hypothetical protein